MTLVADALRASKELALLLTLALGVLAGRFRLGTFTLVGPMT